MLSNKFKQVISNIEKQLSNKEDLDFVKRQITELTMSYINELERLEKNYDSKVAQCTERIDFMEKDLEDLKDKVVGEEIDVEPITCPYCNSKFLIEFDKKQKDIKCPDCRNIIELDWEEYEDDM